MMSTPGTSTTSLVVVYVLGLLLCLTKGGGAGPISTAGGSASGVESSDPGRASLPGGQAGGQAGGCLFKGQHHAAGDTWTTTGAGDGCAEFSCEEDGEITTTWCGYFLAGPTCRRVRGDPSAPYPACCPKLLCS